MIESKEYLSDIEKPWREAPEEWVDGMMSWGWNNDGTTFLKVLVSYKKIEKDGSSWENMYEIRYRLPKYLSEHIKNRERWAVEEIQNKMNLSR